MYKMKKITFGTIKLGWMPEYCMLGSIIVFEDEE